MNEKLKVIDYALLSVNVEFTPGNSATKKIAGKITIEGGMLSSIENGSVVEGDITLATFNWHGDGNMAVIFQGVTDIELRSSIFSDINTFVRECINSPATIQKV